jgi:hypothetical protein
MQVGWGDIVEAESDVTRLLILAYLPGRVKVLLRLTPAHVPCLLRISVPHRLACIRAAPGERRVVGRRPSRTGHASAEYPDRERAARFGRGKVLRMCNLS